MWQSMCAQSQSQAGLSGYVQEVEAVPVLLEMTRRVGQPMPARFAAIGRLASSLS